MEPDHLKVLLILAGALVLFITEVLPLGVTGLCILVVTALSGVLTAQQALSALSSPAVITVGALYVVTAALIRTGVAAALGQRIVQAGRGSEGRLLLVAMLAAAAFSAVLNNTSVVVLFLPIMLAAAHQLKVAPSRLLMPLSFAAILGGTLTLIGTSTNILVADLALTEADLDMGLFEFAPLGLCYAGIGLTYLWTVGRRLLPSRPTVSSITGGRTFEYVTELRVPAEGPATALSIERVLQRVPGTRLLQWVRGEEIVQFTPDSQLQPGDLLVMRGPAEELVSLRRDLKLEALPGVGAEPETGRRAATFAEIVVTPASPMLGRTLSEVGLRRTHGVIAIALQRMRAHLRSDITDIPLKVGDVILVQGTPENVETLRDEQGCLLLTGVQERIHLRGRAPVAVAILGGFLVLAAVTDISLPLLALTAAAASVVTGCLATQRASQAIDWNILGLLAGSIALGMGMYNSGLSQEAADLVLGLTHDMGPAAPCMSPTAPA